MATTIMAEEEAGQLNCVEDDHYEYRVITSCSYFHGLCSRWRIPHRNKSCGVEQQKVKDHQNWLVKGLKIKVKALSGISVKGKTSLLQRFKTCSGGNDKKRRMQFQYDPKSYALNFDDRIDKEGDDGAYLDFSARYACTLGMNKVYLELRALVKTT